MMKVKGEPKLSDEARAFVVQALACFDTPTTVSKAVKAEFDFVISPQAVECYNPTKRAGQKLSERWRMLFEQTRKTFLEDVSQIGISHRAVRLRAIQRMAEKAESVGNIGLAAQLYEQAAKESGNSYTNKREVTGKDGKDLPTGSQVTVFALPDNGR